MADSLTASERKIARTLLRSYPVIGLETVSTFSKAAGVSSPSVLRFVSKLGFDNYAAFQRELRDELQKTLEGPSLIQTGSRAGSDSLSDDRLASIATAVQERIARTVDTTSRAEFATALKLLDSEPARVFLIGGRFTEVLARYFFVHLREIRSHVTLIEGQSTTWPEHLLDMKEGDVVVIFDIRRYQEDLGVFAKAATNEGARLVLFTDQFMSPISALAEVVFNCWVDIPSVWDSSVPIMTVIEALNAALTDRREAETRERLKRLDEKRESLGWRPIEPSS